MNSDYTQQQSLGGLQRSEKLSLQSTTPPAEIPGYRIEKLLGQGAFGEVWQGFDLNTGRPVAVKFYLHRSGVDWSLLRREVKHLVNMSTGRYIVQVLGVGWEAEPPYYVMEHLERGSLEDMVRARGSLSISETVRMLREIADGLSFAHSKGVLHCDLKPANILLDHDWRPRLADFGQSRMSDEQTPSLGTLFYMAPEQADLGAAPDAAWDVYALGSIAYSMLVGSPPYRTPEVVETLDTANSLPNRLQRYRETIRKAPKPRLHYRRRGIDKGLCQIVDRCLAVRPLDRFQNVQQVIGAIDNWERARTRRPLYLLGIVGPILLLLLMMLFSARSISVAKEGALQRIQQRSLDSNQFAAKFAAKTLESEIDILFRLVASETRREELTGLLLKVTEQARPQLEQLADGKPHPQAFKELIALDARQELEDYLRRRLQEMRAQEGDGSGAALFNSIFITDAQGTNLGITFADPNDQTESSPVGRNFAYRSYFNGQRSDSPQNLDRSQVQPTRGTRLSSSFRSTSTGKWKIGVSVPIWEEHEYADDLVQPPEDVIPIGVLVLTMNLGDFELLSEASDPNSRSRFAALVDVRDGNQKGTLLQHPLIQAMDRETMKHSSMPQMSEHQVERLQSSEGVIDYIDPASEFPNGGDFTGEWIAAMQQVQLPRASSMSDSQRPLSDLWVLVQERASSIEAPLSELGSQLQRETYIELVVLLAVIALLWSFVLRIGQDSGTPGPSINEPGHVSSFQSTVDHSR
ncbi:protein kinase domain-containing protein [Aureliella helgolandensis]|uniref:Serine/threonine-protein kinase PknB n=1 Tax=Aureliella helgolandensis TaxID=2527968 RepID=A0A518G8S1_9BACT|nr:protein kinase [Aureliella helgolandensis]QDV24991.1 Serine/threonine-protein kinase PknB [Aureliella helgolandensis]